MVKAVKNKTDLWQTVLAQIELDVSPVNFGTWFKNTEIISQNNEEIVISVPNSFAKEWLKNKYKKNILKILRNQETSVKKINFAIVRNTRVIRPPTPIKEGSISQPRFDVFERNEKTGLNKRYTFDNFIVGGFNELAHAAAIAICDKPGVLYNPLFVYGKVGLGKTHLLQAAGNEIIKKSPQKRIKYVPAERLISEIIMSIRNGNIENVKNTYREVDVLIIDDIQFLTRKEKTQEEFFHIFNALYQKNKQIILSSDRPPKAIASLMQRLRSRFEGGMTADIGLPDLETRIAILKSKAQDQSSNLFLDFSEEIYNYLAENIPTNIRELEGALNRITLYGKTHENKKISLKKVEFLTEEFVSSSTQKVTPKGIIQAVADFYDIGKADLFSSSRRKEIVRPRQIAMYLLRVRLKSSYPFIARKFRGKDHTTAIYSCRKILKEIETNEELKRDIGIIQMRFTNI